MSVTKEIDQVAQGVADHIKEIIYDTVEWQIADFPVNGDEYNAIPVSYTHLTLPTILRV